VASFDLLIRGGTVVGGTAAPARPADVGIIGDRILAIGDLSGVDGATVATVVDASGRVVTPGRGIVARRWRRSRISVVRSSSSLNDGAETRVRAGRLFRGPG
jgi:predicted amidohydrolase